MKKTIEKIGEIAIIGFLIFLVMITYQDHSFESNLNTIAWISIWIGIYYIQTKWLIPKFLKGDKAKYFAISIIILLASLIIGIFVKAIHLEEMNYRRYYSLTPLFDYLVNFEWFYFKETVYGILLAYIISSAYGFIKNLNWPQKPIFQKVIPITILTIILLGVTGISVYTLMEGHKEYPVYDYKTVSENRNIIFLDSNNSVSSLEDILDMINNGKPTAVLFWAKSCSGQITNLIRLNEIREEISNNEINFLFIAGEYQGEEELLQWKDLIISRNIEGYHIHLNREQFSEVFIEDLGLRKGVQDINLILLNSNHEIINEYSLPLRDQQILIDRLNTM